MQAGSSRNHLDDQPKEEDDETSGALPWIGSSAVKKHERYQQHQTALTKNFSKYQKGETHPGPEDLTISKNEQKI